MRTGLLLILACLGSAAHAEKAAAPLAALPAAAVTPLPVTASTALAYHLSDLQAVSMSTYPGGAPTLLRHYLHFRNADGNHYLVYEEEAGAAGLKEVAALRQSMQGGGVSCALELDCRKKAFCTGKCANMYYQISNVPSATGDSDRCRLVSHTCIQASGREPAAAK